MIVYKSVLSSGEGGVPVDSLDITTPAVKTTFNVGETFSSTGLVVTATLGHLVGDVTQDCTFSPSVGTEFTVDDLGYSNVSIQYGGETITYQIRVKQGIDIVPWATGTDAQISAMIDAHYAGEINLYEISGWEVGATRDVTLSAMPATGVDETHSAQTVQMVLMHEGGIDLVNPINSHNTCAFVVGMKNNLGGTGESGYIDANASLTNYKDSARHTWCNEVFRESLSSSCKGWFKQFKNISYVESSKETLNDYFSLFSVVEIFADADHPTIIYTDEGFQFDYYKTSQNRLKKQNYWTRTREKNTAGYFRRVTPSGSTESKKASTTNGISVFGVI